MLPSCIILRRIEGLGGRKQNNSFSLVTFSLVLTSSGWQSKHSKKQLMPQITNDSQYIVLSRSDLLNILNNPFLVFPIFHVMRERGIWVVQLVRLVGNIEVFVWHLRMFELSVLSYEFGHGHFPQIPGITPLNHLQLYTPRTSSPNQH